MNQDETPARPDVPPPSSQPDPAYPPPPEPAYPPQQAYGGYPQQGGAYAGAHPERPGFNLQDLLARWRSVLYPPSVAAFDEQKPAAHWNTINISLALLGIVQGVFALITGFEYHRTGVAEPGVGTIIGNFIGVFIAFYIGTGILYLIARIFGGTGSFLEHAWLLSLVWVPIQAVSAVIGVIPFLGGLVAAVLGIYSIVLYIFATASAHRMTLGRATVVVLIPAIALFVIVLILIAVAAAFLIGLGLSIPGR